jgi:hypothetical protein
MCCNSMNRRDFLTMTTGMVAGAGFAAQSAGASEGTARWTPDEWNPDRPFLVVGKPLKVQPILMYATSHKREATSWRSWGGVQSDQSAAEETARIDTELKAMAASAGFPLDIRPAASVKTAEEAARARRNDADVVVVYPATGGGNLLRACLGDKGDAIVFVRHRSGPVYYWYEALSVKYLNTDGAGPGRVSVDDVVVDDYQDLLWRLRGLYGAKNFVGARIVALGGAGGKYAGEAPRVAVEKYKLQIVDVSYKDFEPRLRRIMADSELRSMAERWTDRYLALPGTTLATDRKFVVNAFLLYGLCKDLMRENNAPAFTINSCMGTIMPMSQTTACLTLSLLNDEGLLAFCESDFVIIPPGILLRYVSGTPVFMHNSTFPHRGMVTCAHCTGPRRMDGSRYEPSKIVTHYESEYGAAPKVDMPKGQVVTFVDPEYATGRWLGFTGKVEDNPFYEICRSQQDVVIQGNWRKLMREVRDSHWMMAYGDHVNAVGYAARKIGIRWETLEPA